MSSFQIKLWACFFMLVDHAGLILFPDIVGMRIVGRLAFPLFAWAIANGFSHTRSAGRYLTRLFLFGLCIQLPYSWYFNVWQLNIFFTLSIGLLAIWFFRWLRDRHFGCWGAAGGLDHGLSGPVCLGFLAATGLGMLADAVQADYGLYGVLTIFLFYDFRDRFSRLFLAQALLNLIFILLPYLAWQSGGSDLSYMDWIQPLSLAALFFVYRYNGEKGRSWKYLFYIFYPTHLVLLYGIKQLLQ